MNGCNPLLEWMGMVDTNGVNLACYTPVYEDGIFHVISVIIGFVIGVIIQIGMLFAGIALFLVRLITDESLVLGVLGGVLQKVLDVIHFVVPPFALASLAFGIVMLRSTAPGGGDGSRFFEWLIPSDKQKEMRNKIPKHMRSQGFDYYYATDPIKTFTRSTTQAIIVAGIIYLLSLNPIYLLVKIINAVAGFGSSIIDSGDAGMSYATGMIEGLVGIVNFPQSGMYETAMGQCREAWITSMANSNGDILKACLGDMPSAGVVELLVSIMFFIVIGTLAYYLFQLFLRGSLFLIILIWDFVLLPYKLGWEMFKPDFTNGDKRWYDKIEETLFDFFLYLFYFLIVVFLLTSGPTLIVYAVSIGEMPAIVQYLIISITFYLGGKFAYKIEPPKEFRDRHLTSWNDLTQNVFYQDEITGRRGINWTQLGNNLKGTEPAVFGRAIVAEKGVGMDDLRKLDEERKKQVRSAISNAAGLQLESNAPVPAMYQDMWDNVDSHLRSIPNQIAATNALYAAGKISEGERNKRINEYQNRENILRDMQTKKRDLQGQQKPSKKSENQKEVPERLKGILKKDTASQEEIDNAEKLASAGFISEYLESRGIKIAPEQIVEWDDVEDKLREAENNLATLNDRRPMMSADDYSSQFDKIVANKNALSEVLKAKNVFAAVEATPDTLVKDPETKKWITQKQLNDRLAKKDVLDDLGFTSDEYTQWQEKDTLLPSIEAEMQSLNHKKHAKTIDEKTFTSRMKTLKEQQDRINLLDYHMNGITREGGLIWVHDPDNNGEEITSYELERRNQEKEAEKRKNRPKNTSTNGSEAPAEPETLESILEKDRRRFAESIALGGSSQTTILDEIQKLGKEQSEKLQQLENASTPEERDKLLREVDELNQQHRIRMNNLNKYEELLSQNNVIGIKNPFYDPSDPMSKQYKTYVSQTDLNDLETNESFIIAETEKANLSAQRGVFDAVQSALNPIYEATQIAQKQANYSSTDIVSSIEKSIESAKALSGAAPDSEQAQAFAREVEAIEQTLLTASSRNENTYDAIARAASSLSISAESFVQDLATDRGRSAGAARAEEILSRFEQQGIKVNLPKGPRLTELDMQQLQSLSPVFLEKLGEQINVTLDNKVMEQISQQQPSLALINQLDYEGQMIARNIYEVGESAVTADSIMRMANDVTSNPASPIEPGKRGNLFRTIKDQQSRDETEGGYATTLPLVVSPYGIEKADGEESGNVIVIGTVNNEGSFIGIKPYVLAKDL